MSRARDIADGKFANDLTVDTNTLHVDAANNRVGVGTLTPADHLAVVTSGANAQVSVDRSDGATGRTVLIHSSSGGQLQTTGSVPLIFGTADTERGRFLSGGGLTFNGDTAAANALDDYEEGDFTPELRASTANPSSTVSGVGKYTKIGRTVTFNFIFANKTISGADGNIQIVNMPFVSTGAINAVFPIASHNMDSDGTFSSGLLTGGSTTMEILYMRDATSWQNIAIQNVINFYLYVGGSYITSS